MYDIVGLWKLYLALSHVSTEILSSHIAVTQLGVSQIKFEFVLSF